MGGGIDAPAGIDAGIPGCWVQLRRDWKEEGLFSGISGAGGGMELMRDDLSMAQSTTVFEEIYLTEYSMIHHNVPFTFDRSFPVVRRALPTRPITPLEPISHHRNRGRRPLFLPSPPTPNLLVRAFPPPPLRRELLSYALASRTGCCVSCLQGIPANSTHPWIRIIPSHPGCIWRNGIP